MVTFQYSLSLSPLPRAASVSRSTFVPSSFFSRQIDPDWISSPAWPFSDRVALSLNQHWSPVLRLGLSSEHEAYLRSMNPGQDSQPSPSQPPWLFDPPVRPSMLPEE